MHEVGSRLFRDDGLQELLAITDRSFVRERKIIKKSLKIH